jgi:hypothetical protein
MVQADGRLYALTRDGTTVVPAANPKYDTVATNKLGAGEQMVLGTTKHPWCIGETE